MKTLALLVIAAAAATTAAAPLPLALPRSLAVQQGDLVPLRLPVPGTGLTLDGRPVPLTADGGFVIGFDRDAGPAAELSWTTRDGRRARWPVTVAPHGWDIDRLPERYSRPGPPNIDYDTRRAIETGQVKAARATVSDFPFWRARWQMPVDVALGRISTNFGAQRIYGETPASPHGGMDIAVPMGTPVRAPVPAVVRLATAGPFLLEGNLVILDHGHGVYSAMMHLSRIDVKAGDIVAQGQVIGAVGSTGRSTGPHLHWGLSWDDGRGHVARVDPASLFDPRPRATPRKVQPA